MAAIKFIYLNNKYIIKVHNESVISDILKNYASILGKSLNELYFIYKGKSIPFDNNKKIKEFKGVISIFVFDINKNTRIQKRQITCPICENPVSINIKNDKISIENCVNKHYFYNLSLNDFINIIKFNEKKIKCECGNNIYNYNKFYFCSCKNYFCPICYKLHSVNKDHYLIIFNERFSICQIHNSNYISFCNSCKVNLCNKCEFDHSQHKIMEYKEIINENKIKEFISDIDTGNALLKQYNSQIQKLNNLFTNFIFNIKQNNNDSMKIYDYLSKYLNNSINYECAISIDNFKVKNYLENIRKLLNQNTKTKIKYLLDLYSNLKNELTIIYCSNNQKKIRLFGENFVKNNKNNCFLFVNNKKKDLCEYYNFEKNFEEVLIVKLIETKTISDMSFMFSECESLSFVPNFSNWNTDEVIDMKYMFYDCISLQSLPDISKWNTNNIEDMKYMFFNCKNLLSLPDISNWNTSNVTDMSYMFANCQLLKLMPDISNWDILNVKNISFMFYNCESLTLFPDISIWKVEKVLEMQYMFTNCKKLLYLPDITKWNIKNAENFRGIFQNVRNEISIEYKVNKEKPKIRLFGEIFVKNNYDKCYIIINNIIINLCEFYECNENDIIKGKLNVILCEKEPMLNICYMFCDCTDLISLPDINSLNTEGVKDMSYMFYNCISLSSLPDIFKWNLSSVKSMNNIFNNIINQMNIIYKISNQTTKIKIFGKQFVENNINNCLIVVENKVNYLTEFYNLKNSINNKELVVQLYEINQIDNLSYLFDDCNDLISLPDISRWNTLNIKDMSYLFSNCISLNCLDDISKWNTKNIINMAYMFNNLKSLLSFPDISNWDISNVISIKNLFSNCESLSSLPDISKWNTSKVEDLSHLFSNCKSLIDIPDISEWNTINAKYLNNMFYNCEKIKYLPDISKWNTQNVKDMSNMFYNCSSLIKIPDISKWNISNVDNMSYMFWRCKSLIDFPSNNWNGVNIKNLSYMFGNCQSLKNMPDITKWNLKNIEQINHLFFNTRNEINIIYYINKQYSSIKLFDEIFIKNNKDKLFLLINNKVFNLCEDYQINENIKEEKLTIKLIEKEFLTDLSYMFQNCELLFSIPNFSEFNMNKINNMSHMFFNCINLESLDTISNMSSWDISKVNDTSYMFYNCKSLITLPDMSKWNTKNIKNMSYMFSNCESLTNIPDISKWDMSYVNDISYIFCHCKSIKNLPDISKWNISNVENMSYAFFNCKLLNSFPDLSKWDLSNVKYLNCIFGNCESLSNLPDITHWNVKNVIEMNNIFYNIRNEINLIYNINQSNVRIFGESFVKNNINNCLLLFNNNIIKLCEFIKNENNISSLDKNKENSFSLLDDNCKGKNIDMQNKITLKLIEIKKMNNLSYMFDGCDSLNSITDFSFFNTININNISFMFSNCKSLLSIPDISKLNVVNVTNMSSLFLNCESLINIPDISRWKINNNQDLSYMFYNCQLLTSLPDISNGILRK